MFTKNSLDFASHFFRSYHIRCRPVCREFNIPLTAFEILMFLANNPDYHTAKDIVELRGLKANLVSVNVEKLVRDGYLDRQIFPGDRRKTILKCTVKARPIIDRGRQLQASFVEEVFRDVDEASRINFFKVIEMMEHNLKDIIREGE